MMATMDRDQRLAAARLKALGHPVRLGIARRLAAEPETCACDFAEVFGVSQPTVSQHLRVLREAGLVTTRRRGTQICYSLEPGSVRALQALLGELGAVALRSA
jgi:ArsR family transcriptional regulator